MTPEQMAHLQAVIEQAVADEGILLEGVAAGELDEAMVVWFGQTYAGQTLALFRELTRATAQAAAELEKLGIHVPDAA